MRIAIATIVRRRVGGIESYINALVPALVNAGHTVALWHESEGPRDRPLIHLPEGVRRLSAAELGLEAAAADLRAWGPDVIFSQGVTTPEVEELLLGVAPNVLFIHAYHGACISGAKSRLGPVRKPCPRPLGGPCLLHYLPRRCGGLNPVTMIRQYDLETRRRDLLPRYAGLVTASPQMRAEYERYQVLPGRLHTVDLIVEVPNPGSAIGEGSPVAFHNAEAGNRDTDRRWNLLFLGRLFDLKGVHLLIDALPQLAAANDRHVHAVIAGEGPAREPLERQARRVEALHSGIRVKFTGWLTDDERLVQTKAADLLVCPSVWPEPFGMVGPEAGLAGLPAAAFAVGGIPSWLMDGVNGHLASADPPRSSGLADAISRCLRDPLHHDALRAGARATARRFTVSHHLDQILPILARASDRTAMGSLRTDA